MKLWTKTNIKFINACRDILGLSLPEAKETLEYALWKRKGRNDWLKEMPLKHAKPIKVVRKFFQCIWYA